MIKDEVEKILPKMKAMSELMDKINTSKNMVNHFSRTEFKDLIKDLFKGCTVKKVIVYEDQEKNDVYLLNNLGFRSKGRYGINTDKAYYDSELKLLFVDKIDETIKAITPLKKGHYITACQAINKYLLKDAKIEKDMKDSTDYYFFRNDVTFFKDGGLITIAKNDIKSIDFQGGSIVLNKSGYQSIYLAVDNLSSWMCFENEYEEVMQFLNSIKQNADKIKKEVEDNLNELKLDLAEYLVAQKI